MTKKYIVSEHFEGGNLALTPSSSKKLDMITELGSCIRRYGELPNMQRKFI